MTACSVWNAANATAAAVEDPTVSAVAASDSNSLDDEPGGHTQCYAGLKFDYNETEYVATGIGGYSSVGTWLDSGTPEQVWVEFLRSSGSKSQFIGKSNSTRYQITSDSVWRITDTDNGGGSQNITGRFRFWDAASGGNILQTTTASQTWTANLTENPCPLCCFTPWTLITMADGGQSPIIEVRVGDLIRVENGIEAVSEIITRVDRVMYLLKFTDGRILEASEDHPLYVHGKGYAAVNPDPRISYKDLGVAKRLEVGDRILDERGQLNQIVAIDDMHYPQTVYTFGNSKFFANGMLVY